MMLCEDQELGHRINTAALHLHVQIFTPMAIHTMDWHYKKLF
jgi:hypothetical protein